MTSTADIPNPATTKASSTGWDDRALLLLGVLADQRRHGYQVNEFIEQRLSCIYPMKKPTAYAILARLESAGAITVHTEQLGNRPPRRVYTMTERGRALYLALLEQNLRRYDQPNTAADIGLIFLSSLDRQTALDALRERLAAIEDALAAFAESAQATAGHHENLRLDLALDRAQHLRESERDWLRDTIDRLSGEG